MAWPKGKEFTDEHRAKLSAARKAYCSDLQRQARREERERRETEIRELAARLAREMFDGLHRLSDLP